MDKNLSKSVIKVFVELHKKKLIYKAEKLVNWDTVLKTAISDLEVDQREMNSKIYYIRYPIENSSEFITIATTRPETMLGDTAIAVNPKDKRYKSFVGKTVTIPIVGRKIKIIKDNYADPEQGTGALKITPAHDFNDYDVGQRNKLEIINVFTEEGKINENAPKDYTGLDRFVARKKLLKELKELISGFDAQQIKKQVNEIKTSFNNQFGEILAEKKEAFLAEGGQSIDFKFSSPLKTEFNKLIGEHKKKLSSYYNSLEKQLKENLEKRLQVIEELKDLIVNAEPTTMYNKFRIIQNKWKGIGQVPKTKYNDTWKTYHFHVDRFYDLLHLSKDLREIDFKNNLEEKIAIIEKAESLQKETDIISASKELQELHRRWKEDVGPVAKELREEIWQRFSAATKIIHDRRHDYYKEQKQQEGIIIQEKLKVIEAIGDFDTSKNKSHKDWQASIRKIEELRKRFFDAGKLPYQKSEDIWQKFKKATKKFNTDKNNFYKQEKKKQQENAKKKKPKKY